MATGNGTAGNDFIHIAGDGLIAPDGYNDVIGLTNNQDFIIAGAGTDIIHAGGGIDVVRVFDASHISGLAEVLDGGAGNDALALYFSGFVDLTNVQFIALERVAGGSVFGSGELTVLLTPSQMNSLMMEGDRFIMSEAGTVIYNQSSFLGTLVGSSGNDTISLTIATKGEFAIEGAGGDDIISVGGSANTTLSGDDGDDIITGGKKADTIDGGADDDVLTGGKKDDSLTGGSGADQFVLKSLTDSALDRSDVITDFSQADGDRINLKKIDADLSVVKDQAFHLGGGVFTQTAGELIQFQQGGQTIVQGDVNGDGQADFALILDGALTLTASDFLL